MHHLKFFFPILFLVGLRAEAADIGGISFSGEVAFDYNFLSSKENAIPNTENASNETYRLNGALVRFKKEDEQILFLGRLKYAPKQYSPDGTSTETADFGVLNQLEVFYKATPSLHIGFGRLITTLGYDFTMRSLNSFYNNTIAFQKLEPGSGEGVRVNYIPSEQLTVSATTYNQFNFDATGEDFAPSKTTEISAALQTGEFNWFAGYLSGKDASTAPAVGTTAKAASNLWLSYNPGNNTLWVLTYDSLNLRPESSYTQWVDSTSAMVVYTYGMNNFGLRYEKIRGANEIGYGAAKYLDVLYITDKIKLTDHLNLYIEGRYDHADQDVFVKADGSATAKATMVTLAALAYF